MGSERPDHELDGWDSGVQLYIIRSQVVAAPISHLFRTQSGSHLVTSPGLRGLLNNQLWASSARSGSVAENCYFFHSHINDDRNHANSHTEENPCRTSERGWAVEQTDSTQCTSRQPYPFQHYLARPSPVSKLQGLSLSSDACSLFLGRCCAICVPLWPASARAVTMVWCFSLCFFVGRELRPLRPKQLPPPIGAGVPCQRLRVP